MTELMLELGDDIVRQAELARWRVIEREECAAAFAPARSLDIARWATDHLWMSPEENNGELQKYDPALTPWHPTIMEAMGSLRVRKVVGVLPAQVGGKTTLMKADLGARISQRPSPIIWGVPRDKDVRTWSKDRIDPMLRDVPVLRGLVSDDTRDKNNTIARKFFPGGYLSILGMTQSADLQGRPVAIIRIDELDQAARDAGKQGAPLRQLISRMKRFVYRNIAIFGTPTHHGDSPMMEEYETTNQAKWNVPCPLCKKHQVLMWGAKDLAWGLKWNDGNPDTAHYVCQHCLGKFGERHKRAMNAEGHFVAEYPDRTEEQGFWMNALVGMFDGSRWPILIKEFHEAKAAPLKLQQFVNSVLCETYEDRTTRLAVNILHTRLERYHAEVPHGVAVLTRSVDTMDDRLEVATFGYGADRETWPVDYEYLPGDPATPVPWRALDRLREKRYVHASGRPMRPVVCFVDKLGHHTSHVNAWTKKHKRDIEPAFSISGDGKENHPILGRPVWDKHSRTTHYRIGTWAAKFDILTRLNGIDLPDDALITVREGPLVEQIHDVWRDPMFRIPGYFHLPDADWFDEERLKQLAESEVLIELAVRGRMVKKWDVLGPNHYLDLAVYSLAGLYTMGTKVVYEQLGAMAEAMSSPYSPPIGTAPPPTSGRRMISSGIRVV